MPITKLSKPLFTGEITAEYLKALFFEPENWFHSGWRDRTFEEAVIYCNSKLGTEGEDNQVRASCNKLKLLLDQFIQLNNNYGDTQSLESKRVL